MIINEGMPKDKIRKGTTDFASAIDVVVSAGTKEVLCLFIIKKYAIGDALRSRLCQAPA